MTEALAFGMLEGFALGMGVASLIWLAVGWALR
jgi:hypothetical protein